MMENDYERSPGLSFSGCKRIVFNIITIIVLLTTVVVGIVLVVVFVNPQISINPFPPPTMLPTLGSPTPTQTPARTLPPAWTPTQTEEAGTEPEATPSPTDEPPTATITETPEEVAEYPFVLQVGCPAPMENFSNESGCEYMGVFGQVFNMDNQPILDLTVHLGGELEGIGEIDLYALTGSELDVGPGGYLFNVATEPIASTGTLWIQLEDGSGNPISEQVYLDTSDSCSENLIMVNWRQVR